MYYILFGFCYLISLLPFPVLYRFSDLLYVMVYYLLGYRKKVVMENLEQAFPEKSFEERQALAKKYYRNLTDMMVETIKLLSISKKALCKRFSGNLSVFHELHRKGKSCQVHLGHHFNWEWANLYFTLGVADPFLVVYMPITNKAVNRLFLFMRSRFGSMMIPANDVQRAMQPWQHKQYISVLVADQNPSNPRRCYWSPFLHRMTAFYKGPELSARRGNIPVVFAHIKKIKRGHYQTILQLAFENPKMEKEGRITEAFVRFLEEKIHEQPELWLWSHRRWKHKWNPEQDGNQRSKLS